MFNGLTINTLYAIADNGKTFKFDLPLSDTVVINGKNIELKMKYDELAGLTIQIDNRQYPVEILKSKQNKYCIAINGISYHFAIETPFSLKRTELLQAGKKGQKMGDIGIKAPMPGKITDIFVNKNSFVSKNETLLVLEAMKMENEILSPVNGTVVSISVKNSDNVMKDDILITIKPEHKQ